MTSLKINEDVCRICLKETIKLNWNKEMLYFFGISYKDCYYKYTQLEKLDSDCFPTSLCEMCANELEKAHLLFEKALESFNFFQAVLRTKQLETQYEIQVSDVDETLIDTEEEQIYVSELSDCDQAIVEENEALQPTHYIDMDDIESFDETFSEFHLGERTQLRECYDTDESRRGDALTKTSLKTQISNLKSTENKIKNAELSAVTSLEKKNIESCEKKLKLTAPKTKKLDCNLLMCSYCSLMVEARYLAEHEATHSENRKRTETCPQCGIKLYTKMMLRQHMKIHDENRQKNYKCEFCGNGFYNRGSLNIHRRKHLGLMVKCQLCTKEYFRQIDLDKHLLQHSASPIQRNVAQKKYVVQCKYCNKSVLTVRWKGHLAAHLDQPEVKCKICDKNFFSRRNCTSHLRRFHRKNSSEYEKYIHYYNDRKTRISILMMKQQLNAQPRAETL